MRNSFGINKSRSLMTATNQMEIDMTNNFASLTLADQYAVLKAEADAIAKQLEAVKAAIKATGLEVIEGEQAIVTVSLSERSSLDACAAKKLLTPEQVAACTKVSLVATIRVKPRLIAA